MTIWIRSQDEDKLINVNVHLCVDYAEYDMNDETELKPAKYGIWGDNAILGIYSTKEKALTVLDEITSWINDLEYARNIKSYRNTFVYQMPQDDEVEE